MAHFPCRSRGTPQSPAAATISTATTPSPSPSIGVKRSHPKSHGPRPAVRPKLSRHMSVEQGSREEEQTQQPIEGKKWKGLHVLKVFQMSPSRRLIAAKGTVVEFEGEAIVNSTNTTCLNGTGVDGAIMAAGGPELAAARKSLPIVRGESTRCLTGEARFTSAFGSLKCKHVIHAVGPNYNSLTRLDKGDEMLKSAYASAIRQATNLGSAHRLNVHHEDLGRRGEWTLHQGRGAGWVPCARGGDHHYSCAVALWRARCHSTSSTPLLAVHSPRLPCNRSHCS